MNSILNTAINSQPAG